MYHCQCWLKPTEAVYFKMYKIFFQPATSAQKKQLKKTKAIVECNCSCKVFLWENCRKNNKHSVKKNLNDSKQKDHPYSFSKKSTEGEWWDKEHHRLHADRLTDAGTEWSEARTGLMVERLYADLSPPHGGPHLEMHVRRWRTPRACKCHATAAIAGLNEFHWFTSSSTDRCPQHRPSIWKGACARSGPRRIFYFLFSSSLTQRALIYPDMGLPGVTCWYVVWLWRRRVLFLDTPGLIRYMPGVITQPHISLGVTGSWMHRNYRRYCLKTSCRVFRE